MLSHVTHAEEHAFHVNGFLIKPTLNLSQAYTTNVQARNANEHSDLITTVKPELLIRKEVRDHRFDLEASTTLRRHVDIEDENTADAHISLSGLLVARRSLKIPLSISHERGHINRQAETDSLSPEKPTRTNNTRITGGFIFNPNRLKVEVIGHYEARDFHDGITDNNLAVVRSDDDHDKIGLNAKASYNMKTGLSPFLQFKTHKAKYEQRSYNGVSFAGAFRDHRYSSVLGGLGFERHNSSGHVAIGYNGIHYDSGLLDDLNSAQISAELNWQPTQKTQVAAGFSRHAYDDSSIESAYSATLADMKVTYEMQESLSAHGYAGIQKNAYETSRSDKIYTGTIGLDYKISRQLAAHANLTSQNRDSDFDAADYTENKILVGLKGNL